MIGPRIITHGVSSELVKRLYYVMPVVTYIRAAFRPYRGGGSPPEGGFELGVDLGPALPSDAPRLPEQSSAIKYNQKQSTAIKVNQG